MFGMHPAPGTAAGVPATQHGEAGCQLADRCTTEEFDDMNRGSVLTGRAREGCGERSGRWGMRRILPGA